MPSGSDETWKQDVIPAQEAGSAHGQEPPPAFMPRSLGGGVQRPAYCCLSRAKSGLLIHIPDRLGLLVLIQGFHSLVLAAKTGQFEATKRRGDIPFGKTIDRHGACFDLA